MPEPLVPRDCAICIYGDNGTTPDGCSSSCWEPDLPDFDPMPITPKPLPQLPVHNQQPAYRRRHPHQ